MLSKAEKIRELVFEIDNNACFIERERVLSRLEDEMKDYTGADKNGITALLKRISKYSPIRKYL